MSSEGPPSSYFHNTITSISAAVAIATPTAGTALVLKSLHWGSRSATGSYPSIDVYIGSTTCIGEIGRAHV